MLSVLIASYNVNVVSLVKELHHQLIEVAIPFEIICLDDASISDLNVANEQINKLSSCSFKILQKNIGRSAIRNALASKAKYNWLLFLDADVLPTSSKFISNYLKVIENSNNTVFLGGIKYRDFDDKNLLRWKFGKKSEEVSAVIRNDNSYKYFFTANFLIRKKTFTTIKFNEDLVDYGYEDLLFSKELNKTKVLVKHIENEVFHLGIDENKVFIEKTKKAIENLNFLIDKKLLQKKDTNISRLYFDLNAFGVVGFLNLFSNFFEKFANQNSSVTFFNLFRVTYLHQILKDGK